MQAAEQQMEDWKDKIGQYESLEEQLADLRSKNDQMAADLKRAGDATRVAHQLHDKLDASQEQVAMLQHCAEAVHSYGSAWLPLTEALKAHAQRDAAQFNAFIDGAKLKVRSTSMREHAFPFQQEAHNDDTGEKCWNSSGCALGEERAGLAC